jgi:hypothetical protein
VAAYVHQNELLFSNLTVSEHLMFHAVNRMSGRLTREQCQQRVDEVRRGGGDGGGDDDDDEAGGGGGVEGSERLVIPICQPLHVPQGGGFSSTVVLGPGARCWRRWIWKRSKTR